MFEPTPAEPCSIGNGKISTPASLCLLACRWADARGAAASRFKESSMRSMLFGALAGAVILLVGRFGAAADGADEGFTLLFNGKDLTGWKTKEGAALEGKDEAYGKRFSVADGAVAIDPKVKGDKYIYTVKEFSGDLHLKFEFNPGPGCNNDLFLRGMKFDINLKGDVKKAKEGEWNTFEIVVAGKKAEFKCNGETVKSMNTKNDASNFGLRAEFGSIQYRKIQVKSGN